MQSGISVLIPIIGRKDLAQQYRNEALIKPRLDDAINAWHTTQPPAGLPEPVIIKHPIDPEQQTGDSQLLGGAMSIESPWRRD